MLQVGKLYKVPFVAQYDNANAEARQRCDEILEAEKQGYSWLGEQEYDRLRMVIIDFSHLVMVVEVDPTRKKHPTDTNRRSDHMYLKLLIGEKVVEVYASKLWVVGFKMVGKAI